MGEEMDRIIRAIHSSVPEELWPEILRKIDSDDETAEPVADEIKVFDPGDRYDPWDEADAGLGGLP